MKIELTSKELVSIIVAMNERERNLRNELMTGRDVQRSLETAQSAISKLKDEFASCLKGR